MGIPLSVDGEKTLIPAPDREYIEKYLESKTLPDSYLLDRFKNYHNEFLLALSNRDESNITKLCEQNLANKIFQSFKDLKEAKMEVNYYLIIVETNPGSKYSIY